MTRMKDIHQRIRFVKILLSHGVSLDRFKLVNIMKNVGFNSKMDKIKEIVG